MEKKPAEEEVKAYDYVVDFHCREAPRNGSLIE